MASGVPVVASAHPSLDEARGDAARPRRPGHRRRPSPAALEEALRRRDELVPRGLEHARRVHAGGDRRGDVRRLLRDARASARRDRRLAARPDARRHGALPPRRCSERERVRAACPGAGRAARDRRARCVVVPARAAAPRARRRRAALPDLPRPVPHAGPLVVTVHDLAVLRHPGLFNQWTRRYSRLAVPRVVRAARRVIAISEFTQAASSSSCSASPPEKVRVIPNAVEAPFAADGPGPKATTCSRSGRSSRARTSPRVREAAQRLGAELRVVGARGLGRGEGRRLASGAVVRRGARRALPRRAVPSRTRRCTKASGSRCSRRWPAAPRSSRRAAARPRRSRASAAVLVDPLDVASIASGLEEASARRDELRAAGLERAKAFSWDRVGSETWAVYEAAGVTPLVVLDADVLGRHRTGDETYVAEPAAAAARAGRRRVPLRCAHPQPRPRARRGGTGRATCRLAGAAHVVVGAARAAAAAPGARAFPARAAVAVGRVRPW